MDYKSTLNLPATEFPMKANLAQREPEQLARWQAEGGLYQRLRISGKDRPRFILHDGPPYANGEIHIGHAVNKILKDFIVKSKTLSGYNAPYVPGWDCHGLPIELMVEKKIGKAGVKVGIAEFREACRKYAAEQVEIQKQAFIRLGVLGDWENPYLTMDYTFEANIIRALGKIAVQGHLSQGKKPVHWCTDCGSALAEAEVEYENRLSSAIDVRFGVIDPADALARLHFAEGHPGAGPLSVVIWTTTPWTLPANQAVALNPELDYAIVQCEPGNERLLMAEALIKDTLLRAGIDQYRVIAYGKGALLEGLQLQHPFLEDRQVPIILGEHVTVDAGTGAVHTAPGHGQEDYVVGQRYGLTVENPVGNNGCFLPGTPYFEGQHVTQANSKVVELLQERGALLHHARIEHSYPHCWRHKTPVIFRATPQWFISMDAANLREQALTAIAGVEWIPDWGQARIEGMIAGRPDWCISRQRNWGAPIALFVHNVTSALHPRSQELIEAVAARVEQGGIEAWFSLDPAALLGDEVGDYSVIRDTLDVWFDSGVTHACVLQQRPELHYPADLYLEGSDQHRGWFQSSLLSAVAMNGTAPYKAVLTHGFTVDAHGHKMSKSKGNVVAPQKVMQSLGADVLRLWVSATDYRGEMTVSDEILKRISDVYRRLRNTARYLLANLDGFDPALHQVKPEDMLAMDRWAVDCAYQLQQEIIAAYDNYQFNVVYQKAHHFCAVELGAFYLDVLKDRQYTCQTDSLPRRSSQTALYHIAEAMTRWLAPILSFTAEEIWQHLPGDRSTSVFEHTWYTGLFTLDASAALQANDWAQLLRVRDAVSKELEALRGRGDIGSSLDAEVDLYCAPDLYELLTHAVGDELRFLLLTSYARIHRLSDVTDSALLETAEAGLKLHVVASTHEKCVRCWHHRADIGMSTEHPELCGRCVENVDGPGEIRKVG